MDKKSSYEVTSLEDQIRRITSWVVDIILAALLAFFLTWAFGTRVTMVGNSMDPLLSGGDSLMINRLKNRLTEPQRFDIAAYTLEGDDSVYLKLVLGLPGESTSTISFSRMNGWPFPFRTRGSRRSRSSSAPMSIS